MTQPTITDYDRGYEDARSDLARVLTVAFLDAKKSKEDLRLVTELAERRIQRWERGCMWLSSLLLISIPIGLVGWWL
jgi:hypothetical protein